jgi:hypothetical protein
MQSPGIHIAHMALLALRELIVLGYEKIRRLFNEEHGKESCKGFVKGR